MSLPPPLFQSGGLLRTVELFRARDSLMYLLPIAPSTCSCGCVAATYSAEDEQRSAAAVRRARRRVELVSVSESGDIMRHTTHVSLSPCLCTALDGYAE